jgi:hypothetical protein
MMGQTSIDFWLKAWLVTQLAEKGHPPEYDESMANR